MNQADKDEQIRKIILNAFRQQIKKYGYNKVTMDDISKAAGKGRSSLYYYYKGKEEILDALLLEEISELNQFVIAKVIKRRSATDKLITYCNEKIMRLLDKINEYLIVSSEILEDPEMYKKISRLQDPHDEEALRSIMDEGIKSGEFRPLRPKEIHLMAVLMKSSIKGIALEMCSQGGEIDITSVKRMVEILFVRGIIA